MTGGTAPYTYLWNPFIGSSNYVTGLAHGNYDINIFDANGCSLTTGFTLPFVSTYCGDLNVTDIDDNPIANVGGVFMINHPYTCLNTVSEVQIKLCQSSPCTFTILNYSGISISVDSFYLGADIINNTISSSGCSIVSLIFNPISAQTYNGFFTITTEYCTHSFSLSGTGVENVISADTQFIDFGNVCFGTADTKYLTLLNLTPDTRTISIQNTPSEVVSSNAIILTPNSTVNIPYTFTPSYPLTYPVLWERQFTGTTKISNCTPLSISLSGTGYGGNLYVSSLDFGCVNRNCYLDQTATIYNTHCLPVTITSVDIPVYYSNQLSILNFSATTIPAGGTMNFDVRYSALTSIATYTTVHTDFSLASVIVSGITACMVDSIGNIGSILPIITVPGIPMTTSVNVTNTSVSNLVISAHITNITGGTPSNLTVNPIISLPAPIYPITGITQVFTISFNDPNDVLENFYLNLTDSCGNHRAIPFSVYSAAIGYTNPIFGYPSCFGNDNGLLTITPSGGTSPYIVVWDNGVTGNTINNVTAGTYNVVITDYYGNSSPFSFDISQPNPLTISHVVPFNGYVNILVYGNANGYIDLMLSGGTSPYSYTWSGYTYQNVPYSNLNEDLTGLTAGNYFVTVTDSHGCQITDFVGLNQPDPLVIVINNCTPPVPPTPYCTLTGGTADITVSGGQGPYSIIVCPTVPQNPLFDVGGPYYGSTNCQVLPNCSGATPGMPCVTQTCYCCDSSPSPCFSACPITMCNIIIGNLPPGNYPPGSFNVTDANSGTTSYTVPTFVPDQSTLGFELTQTETTCGGQANGTITATIIPTYNQLGVIGMGVPPYTYYLNGIQQGPPTTSIIKTFIGLVSDIYTITINDSDNNTVTHNIKVNQGRLTATITTTSETLQEANGSITITGISGGVGPYYASKNSSVPVMVTVGYVFNNLPAGSYLIQITDSLGCTFTIKPIISRTTPTETGQKIFKGKASVGTQNTYEKRLGGFKIIPKTK